MSVIAFPSNLAVSAFRWEQARNDTEFRSVFGAQAIEVIAPLWLAQMDGNIVNDSAAGDWQSLLLSLRGKVNQLSLHNIGRPIPLGTMRGTMTVSATAVAGVSTAEITASGEATKTLLKGDYLGFGSGLTQQVVMVVADATSDGAGVINVTFEPPLRNEFIVTSPVTWDKPTVLFRRNESKAGWSYQETFVAGFGLQLIEDVRP